MHPQPSAVCPPEDLRHTKVPPLLPGLIAEDNVRSLDQRQPGDVSIDGAVDELDFTPASFPLGCDHQLPLSGSGAAETASPDGPQDLEHPSMTAGVRLKPGATFTIPNSFTILAIRSKSPNS